MAALSAAQIGQTAIQNADTLATVGFGGASRILQAVVIILCVIIILIGIIVMSVGTFTTGLIWFAIGAVALGGTIYWTRGNQSFYKPQPAYQPVPTYQVDPRSAYPQPRMPLAQRRFQAPYPGRYSPYAGRGEETHPEVTEEELRGMTEVGGDCGCGDDDSAPAAPAPAPAFPTTETLMHEAPSTDNVIDRLVSPRDVKGAGEAGEFFDEAMLNDLTREGVPRPRRPLTLKV